MSRKIPRLLLDAFMAIAILLAMANKLTENRLHESIGISMLALIVLHNLLNWRWYRAIFQGKYNLRRMLNCMVNMLLVAAMVVLAGSCIMISKTLFSFMGLTSTLALRQFHTTAAYWLLVLMSAHLGLHWARLVDSLKKAIPVLHAVRIPAAIRLLLSVMVVIYGFVAAADRDIFSRLFMVYAFDFWDFKQSVAGFFASYLAIVAAVMVVTHNGLRLLKQRQNQATYSLQHFP